MKKMIVSLLLAGSAVLFAGVPYPSGNDKTDNNLFYAHSFRQCIKRYASVEDGKGVYTVELLNIHTDSTKKIKADAYIALFAIFGRTKGCIGLPVKQNKKYRVSFDMRKTGNLKNCSFQILEMNNSLYLGKKSQSGNSCFSRDPFC